MKNTVQLLAALAFLVSCGPAASLTASDTNRETPDLVDRSGAYANTKIDVKEDEMVGYSNIFDYLRGKVPGVQIGTAGPGGMPSVTIRGASSFNASTEPLYILDGSEVKDISNISPNDIASVEVLKDASSSIYGVRGANGVIIIKTKSAREAALREQAEKKALKIEHKEARKKK